MGVQEATETLEYLYLEEAHRISSDQHHALCIALIVLKALTDDDRESANIVVRYVDALEKARPGVQ